MQQPHILVALITLAALLVCLWTAIRVVGARAKAGVAAPAMTGDPVLERHIRVQANTLEWLPIFLVSLWIFAIYWNDRIAALLGVIWIIGRVVYAYGYVADPKKRVAGFGIQGLATAVLLFGGLGRLIYLLVVIGPVQSGAPVLPVDPARYAAYVSIAAVMVVSPGPANLFAIANGAQRGHRAVLTAVGGMSLASLVWFSAAGLGLSALALAWPAVFRIMAFLGAGYLAWLGLRALWSAWRRRANSDQVPTLRGTSAFRDGFMVQITNPKALVFTTAVLPPFIDPTRPVAAQIASFAATSIFMDFLAMGGYGLGGATLAARLTEPGARRVFALFTGVLLLAAASLIAWRET